MDERKIASEALKEPWLRARIGAAVTREIQLSSAEADCLLDRGTLLRELGRSVLHANANQLYREFVIRHSILSRFVKTCTRKSKLISQHGSFFAMSHLPKVRYNQNYSRKIQLNH